MIDSKDILIGESCRPPQWSEPECDKSSWCNYALDKCYERCWDTKTRKGNLKRRSSVARSIRRSQSNTGPHGFTFEQQLIASTLANDNSTSEEKLQKIVKLSLSATVKTLQQENEQLEVGTNLDIDNARADLIDHHVSTLGRKPLLKEKDIEYLIEGLNVRFKGDFCITRIR